ncbi:MAG: hypothetical protein EXQ85_05335 [Alphaproteobacteria bacterium]|nr:hypothetical protein [Alphaproteobacteria bacterium]
MYDTFAGFSERYSSPADFGKYADFFAFAHVLHNPPGLYERVATRFAAYSNVKVIKGVVPDVLAEVSPQKIAYLHIDMNSPAAELGAIEVLFDRVVPGGVIVLDDYGWLVFQKQREVEDEFMARRGHSILKLPTGQGMVIKRAEADIR